MSLLPEQDEFLNGLFHTWFSPLRRYAAVYLRDADRAEDVVQDTFHEAVTHIETLMRHPHPELWLKTALKYKLLCSERARRRYARRFLSLDTEAGEETAAPGSVEEDAEAGEREDVARQVGQALTPDEVHFLRRFALEKASHLEIADELGISVWASQKRLQRIREKLARLHPEWGG